VTESVDRPAPPSRTWRPTAKCRGYLGAERMAGEQRQPHVHGAGGSGPRLGGAAGSLPWSETWLDSMFSDEECEWLLWEVGRL